MPIGWRGSKIVVLVEELIGFETFEDVKLFIRL
jgi:hypothetical protein